MSKTIKNSSWIFNANISGLILILFILLAGWLSFLNIYAGFDREAEQKVHVFKGELIAIRQKIIKPAHGVRHNGPILTKDSYPIGCIDTLCPSAIEEWLVPIETGKEDQFADNIFNMMGYTRESWSHTWRKDGLRLSLLITSNTTNDLPVPYPAPTNASWYVVQATIY